MGVILPFSSPEKPPPSAMTFWKQQRAASQWHQLPLGCILAGPPDLYMLKWLSHPHLLQVHPHSHRLCQLIKPLKTSNFENWGKEGIKYIHFSLHTGSKISLGNGPNLSLAFLLLPVYLQRKSLLLSSTLLPSFNFRWALAVLTPSLHN